MDIQQVRFRFWGLLAWPIDIKQVRFAHNCFPLFQYSMLCHIVMCLWRNFLQKDRSFLRTCLCFLKKDRKFLPALFVHICLMINSTLHRCPVQICGFSSGIFCLILRLNTLYCVRLGYVCFRNVFVVCGPIIAAFVVILYNLCLCAYLCIFIWCHNAIRIIKCFNCFFIMFADVWFSPAASNWMILDPENQWELIGVEDTHSFFLCWPNEDAILHPLTGFTDSVESWIPGFILSVGVIRRIPPPSFRRCLRRIARWRCNGTPTRAPATPLPIDWISCLTTPLSLTQSVPWFKTHLG